jgi:hypothetical protein
MGSLAKVVIVAILLSPAAALGQSGSTSGTASGPSAGVGPIGTPNTGAAGGLNNSLNDPSGGGNSTKSADTPGTNTLGTANSSGGRSPATSAGNSTTTGSAANRDAAIDDENKLVDKKIKSICRGC